MSINISIKDKKLIKQHHYILKKLASSSPAQRKKILANAPDALFKAINAIIKLVVKNKLQISKKQQHKLYRHKKLLSSVSGLKNVKSVKNKLRNQRGGFIPALIAAALPAITSLIGNLF